MNPHQFAKAECANWSNDECLNVKIAADLSMTIGKPQSRCVLIAGQRCRYFEECVLPMAAMTTEPVKAKSYSEAADEYRLTHQMDGVIRQCPGCGRPLSPRRRLCAVCSQKRRKQTYRAVKARIRVKVSTVNDIYPPKSLAI